MPASYTHYRFGCDVLLRLPLELHARIDAHRSLFNIGLHGPDIFFYYDPFRENPVNRVGHSMHKLTGQSAFHRFLALYDDSDAAFAYLAGFLCHFALDSSCHGYVGEMAAQGVSHTLQETQLDRAILLRDGFDPLRHDLVAHIRPTAPNARVITRFFPQVTERQTMQALKDMVFYHHLLTAKTKPKRRLLDAACRVIGARETFGYMVMQEGEVPVCKPIVERLQALYAAALPLAAELIGSLPALEHPQYQYDFEGALHPESQK